MTRPEVILITGGARSGKSLHALALASRCSRRALIATAEPFDEEMRQRISRHRADRGDAFFVVEEPVRLAEALGRVPEGTEVVVVDCLTVWLGNLLYRGEVAGAKAAGIARGAGMIEDPKSSGAFLVPENPGKSSSSVYEGISRGSGGASAPEDFPEVEAFLAALADPPRRTILVTNEVGLGIVPPDRETRRYRDLIGRLNRRVADAADRLLLMVCGRPLEIPGGRAPEPRESP
jgi:adenosylcobinamide kinase/adenosylcobinamide-phosphate guanylyltransferase